MSRASTMRLLVLSILLFAALGLSSRGANPTQPIGFVWIDDLSGYAAGGTAVNTMLDWAEAQSANPKWNTSFFFWTGSSIDASENRLGIHADRFPARLSALSWVITTSHWDCTPANSASQDCSEAPQDCCTTDFVSEVGLGDTFNVGGQGCYAVTTAYETAQASGSSVTDLDGANITFICERPYKDSGIAFFLCPWDCTNAGFSSVVISNFFDTHPNWVGFVLGHTTGPACLTINNKTAFSLDRSDAIGGGPYSDGPDYFTDHPEIAAKFGGHGPDIPCCTTGTNAGGDFVGYCHIDNFINPDVGDMLAVSIWPELDKIVVKQVDVLDNTTSEHGCGGSPLWVDPDGPAVENACNAREWIWTGADLKSRMGL